MKAGFYECDITPPLGTECPGSFRKRLVEDIHDPLKVRVCVLSDDTQKIALIGIDSIGTGVNFRNKVEEMLPEYALYPFANLQIQSAINTFGVSAIAGSSASGTLENIPASISGSFGSAVTVFMGQNLGAAKKERAKKSFVYCLATTVAVGMGLAAFVYLTKRFWLSLFLPSDPEAVEFAIIRMTFVLLFYWIACANNALSASIQVYGYAIYTSFVSIACVCVFRMIWMWFIYPRFSTFEMLMACFLVSWGLLLVFNIIGHLVFCRKEKIFGVK